MTNDSSQDRNKAKRMRLELEIIELEELYEDNRQARYRIGLEPWVTPLQKRWKRLKWRWILRLLRLYILRLQLYHRYLVWRS